MATYIPNAADSTQPTEDKPVESAALEFRTLKAQEIRGVRFPSSDSSTNRGELPAAASRAGKFLAFDSVTGVPIPGPTLSAWTITQGQIADIETVADNTANIDTVVDNLPEIIAAPTYAAAAAASADEAAASAASIGTASTTNSGVVELATTAEAAAGTDTTRAVTPAGLAAGVPATIANLSAGAIGTYVFAKAGTDAIFGATISGSSLVPTSATWAQEIGSGVYTALDIGWALSGTWRAMGMQDANRLVAGQQSLYGATLWLRIA